jgi:hypothetical protein
MSYARPELSPFHPWDFSIHSLEEAQLQRILHLYQRVPAPIMHHYEEADPSVVIAIKPEPHNMRAVRGSFPRIRQLAELVSLTLNTRRPFQLPPTQHLEDPEKQTYPMSRPSVRHSHDQLLAVSLHEHSMKPEAIFSWQLGDHGRRVCRPVKLSRILSRSSDCRGKNHRRLDT